MKRRNIFIALSLVGLLAVFWWWLSSSLNTASNSASNGSSATQTPKTSQTAEVLTAGTANWIGHSDVQLPADHSIGYNPDLPQWAEWRRRRAEDPYFEWKMPINFWGKVVDQNNKPVPGTTVAFTWNNYSEQGNAKKITSTDDEGNFSLIGVNGKGMSLMVEKQGYHALQGGLGSYEYAAFFDGNYHQPDPKKPVVFRLIKKLEADPLIAGRVHYKLAYDRAPYYYDLEKATLSRQIPKVGIKFGFTRSESQQGQPFDWSWTVEGVNSNLRPTDDEFAQMAPKEGYTSQWQVSQSAKAERFMQVAKTRLYTLTSDGRYAVVDLYYVQSNRRDSGPFLTVKSLLNPSGSRNLEYDPEKRINHLAGPFP